MHTASIFDFEMLCWSSTSQRLQCAAKIETTSTCTLRSINHDYHLTCCSKSMPRQEQPAGALTSPLRDAAILQQVFTFLPGNWLFLGAVCSEWQALCAAMGEQNIYCINSKRLVNCATTTTLYSAAFATPATARLAQSCGLAISDNKALQLTAGLVADIETLAVLRELGMPLSDTVVEAAALSGRLNILQHLLADQQCPRPFRLSHSAALSGSINMLRCSKHRTGVHLPTMHAQELQKAAISQH
jgi:hypothetical protein